MITISQARRMRTCLDQYLAARQCDRNDARLPLLRRELAIALLDHAADLVVLAEQEAEPDEERQAAA